MLRELYFQLICLRLTFDINVLITMVSGYGITLYSLDKRVKKMSLLGEVFSSYYLLTFRRLCV